MLMSNRPRILLRSTAYEVERFNEVLENEVRPMPYRLNLEKNLEQLEQLVDDLKTPARECYLLTDAQERDWADLSEKGRETFRRLTEKANVFVLPIKVDGEDNLSISRFYYASGSLRQGGMARFAAEVKNHGRRQTDGGTVEFLVNDQRVTRRAVGPLEAGETRTISFFYSFDKEGDVRLKASLVGRDDGLVEDNERYAVVRVHSEIRILCVDDEPEGSPDRNGIYYAVRALRLRGRVSDNPLKVTQIKWNDLPLEDLNDYHVIVMADVAEINTKAADRLINFVHRGGGLMVFLGARANAESYNRHLGSGDHDMLPAELLKPVGIEEGQKSWAMGPIRSKHPLAEIIKRLPKELVDSVRFSRVVNVKPKASGATILSVAEQELPLLLHRKVGRGAVLLCTTTADRQWSQFAINPLYPMLMHQAVTNMTSDPDARKITAGETADLPVTGRKVGDLAKVVDPKGITSDVRITQKGEQPVCSVETEVPGVYALPGMAVAANVDAGEANVRVVDTMTVTNKLNPLEVRVAGEGDDLAVAITEARLGRELSFWLLVLGIAVFLLQSFLARLFTHRMSKVESVDVGASLQMSRVAAARRT
jgi:hypothetical protein